jgi:uncharacterized protein with HEPN domain
MQPVDRNPAYLWDMLEAGRLILSFIQDVDYERHLRDRMLQSAIERQPEIIGEAARRITPEFHLAHPEIPWKSLIGLRNILIHEYGEVRQDRIWMILHDRLPLLVSQIESLLPPPPVLE